MEKSGLDKILTRDRNLSKLRKSRIQYILSSLTPQQQERQKIYQRRFLGVIFNARGKVGRISVEEAMKLLRYEEIDLFCRELTLNRKLDSSASQFLKAELS